MAQGMDFKALDERSSFFSLVHKKSSSDSVPKLVLHIFKHVKRLSLLMKVGTIYSRVSVIDSFSQFNEVADNIRQEHTMGRALSFDQQLTSVGEHTHTD